jgi:hypothetical protein
MKNEKPTPKPLKWYELLPFIIAGVLLLVTAVLVLCNPPKHPMGHPRFWKYQQTDTVKHH